MALEGTLASFGIAEIFQLIGTQAKTGTLEIETDNAVARIRFVNGPVLDAVPGEMDSAHAIGEMLVRSGLVTPRQLDYALGVQKRSLRRIGDILIRMGAIRTGPSRWAARRCISALAARRYRRWTLRPRNIAPRPCWICTNSRGFRMR